MPDNTNKILELLTQLTGKVDQLTQDVAPLKNVDFRLLMEQQKRLSDGLANMRAMIYARYSSDNQREASIEDLLRICRERIDREGWAPVQAYRDAAESGATTLRRSSTSA
jgi:hypothetical protein